MIRKISHHFSSPRCARAEGKGTTKLCSRQRTFFYKYSKYWQTIISTLCRFSLPREWGMKARLGKIREPCRCKMEEFSFHWCVDALWFITRWLRWNSMEMSCSSAQLNASRVNFPWQAHFTHARTTTAIGVNALKVDGYLCLVTFNRRLLLNHFSDLSDSSDDYGTWLEIKIGESN